MKTLIKNALGKLGYHIVHPNLRKVSLSEDARNISATKIALTHIFNDFQLRAQTSQQLPRFSNCGFRIFSQFEEDGYLLFLAAVLELKNRTFLDIGSSNGINSNCANLSINLGWHGLFIDGNKAAIEEGMTFYKSHPDTELYPPVFREAFVTAENINPIVTEAGLTGDIGILSIDIDGNDCWVWKSLDAVSPAVVVIETHIEFGMNNIAVPYDGDYSYPGKHPEYFGASAVAMARLGKSKGYRLVGANRYGFNLFFVRNDIYPERVPEVSVESILTHPRYFERLSLAEPIRDWEYVAL